MRYAAVAAVTLALAAAFPAAAKEAKCLLEYEGETYINETCQFIPAPGGSFTLETLDRLPHSSGDMIPKYIAMVDVEGNGRATGNWSGEAYATHVHNPLGSLRRSGEDRACWVSDIARVCAW